MKPESIWLRHPWLMDMLEEQWGRGLSTQRIAAMMEAELHARGVHEEVTKSAVIGKSHRMGLPNRPHAIKIYPRFREAMIRKAVATRRVKADNRW